MADLTLDADTLKTAFDNLDNKEKTALQVAADRVRTYHEKQKQTRTTMINSSTPATLAGIAFIKTEEG
jgi:histidinol dehydrogenase